MEERDLPEAGPLPEDGPSTDVLEDVFRVYETRTDGDRLLYFGRTQAPRDRVLRRLWPEFREAGYELHLSTRLGETVLIAEPRTDDGGVPWLNVALFLGTVLSTLLAGAVWWYYVPPSAIAENPLAMLEAWPFTVAMLGVLGVHELGHYAASRYYDVDASLPYFIPMPTLIGTMGAVIRMRGQIPSRKALFDIGVAGPLAGLAATVVVTVVGLSMDPVTVPQSVIESADGELLMRDPPLMDLLAWLVGGMDYADPRKSVNPVVIGGWVGMFITFLNLIPVGQLDGGHMLRSMIGRRAESVSATVPLVLFGLAGYLWYGDELGLHAMSLGLQDSVLLWLIWGVVTLVFSFGGSANPIDEAPLGRRRKLVGVLTFLFGLLCFTMVPFQLCTAASPC
jgi:membrane-associated protease RseP (regulator of RpoE activity)